MNKLSQVFSACLLMRRWCTPLRHKRSFRFPRSSRVAPLAAPCKSRFITREIKIPSLALCATLHLNDRAARSDRRLRASIAHYRRCLALLLFVRHANDRGGYPFLVYGSAFQASSSRPGRSCSANGKFGLVVVGDHVDAGGLLDTSSTSSAGTAAFS
jgi:hypothetical protein